MQTYGLGKKSVFMRLEKIQTKAFKIMFGNKYLKSIDDIYRQAGFLRLKNLFEYVIILKYSFKMKLKREEMIKQKLDAIKTFQFKQLTTKNKFGETLKQ